MKWERQGELFKVLRGCVWQVGVLFLGAVLVLGFIWIQGRSLHNYSRQGFRRLTKGATHDTYPRWSPTGRHIAFQRAELHPPPGGIDFETFEIFVIGLEGQNLKQLTFSPEHSGSRYPAWSPDGGQIAFIRTDFRANSSVLYSVRADGSSLRRLYQCPRRCRYLDWSPDGTQIVFVMTDEVGDFDKLYSLHLDQSFAVGEIPTPGLRRVKAPRWSSDGKEIVAHAAGVWIIPLSARGPIKIRALSGGEPVLSPSDQQIAFTAWDYWRSHDGLARDVVCTAGRDGSGISPVIAHGINMPMSLPDWSPDGSRLVVRVGGDGYSDLYAVDLP